MIHTLFAILALASPLTPEKFADMQKELSAANAPIESFGALAKIAKFNASAELPPARRVEARAQAERLLKESNAFRTNWNYSNAIHHGNLVLGRIALLGGDVKAAIATLHKAGDLKGSPQLNTFGPNMTLASELLARGEKEAVVAYLNRCAKFWTMGAEKIADWNKDIAAGREPHFGANLKY